MRQVSFVSGNQRKQAEARAVLATYGIAVKPCQVAIDEIQHDDPQAIARAKARAAYAAIGRPVVVNDSFWEIPALGGFPGGYMKQIAQWLTAADFLALMRNKADRRIFLHDTVVYNDQSGPRLFSARRVGTIIDAVRGDATSFQSVVVMQGAHRTIAEIVARRGTADTDRINLDDYPHWHQFGAWYAQRSADYTPYTTSTPVKG